MVITLASSTDAICTDTQTVRKLLQIKAAQYFQKAPSWQQCQTVYLDFCTEIVSIITHYNTQKVHSGPMLIGLDECRMDDCQLNRKKSSARVEFTKKVAHLIVKNAKKRGIYVSFGSGYCLLEALIWHTALSILQQNKYPYTEKWTLHLIDTHFGTINNNAFLFMQKHIAAPLDAHVAEFVYLQTRTLAEWNLWNTLDTDHENQTGAWGVLADHILDFAMLHHFQAALNQWAQEMTPGLLVTLQPHNNTESFLKKIGKQNESIIITSFDSLKDDTEAQKDFNRLVHYFHPQAITCKID